MKNMKQIWPIMAAISVTLILKHCSCYTLSDIYQGFPAGHRTEWTEGSRKYVIINTRLGSGGNSVLFRGQMISGGKTYDVAVKVELAKRNLLPREVKTYKKLDGFVADSFAEGDKCIPKVYYLREKFKIGDVEVNAMFMQQLGKTLQFYITHGYRPTIRETLIVGLRMTECIKFIHDHGVTMLDMKLDHIITAKDEGDFHLFICDFGAASGMEESDYITSVTAICTSPRIIDDYAEGKKVTAFKIDDFYSLLIALIEFVGAKVAMYWNSSLRITSMDAVVQFRKERANHPVEVITDLVDENERSLK